MNGGKVYKSHHSFRHGGLHQILGTPDIRFHHAGFQGFRNGNMARAVKYRFRTAKRRPALFRTRNVAGCFLNRKSGQRAFILVHQRSHPPSPGEQGAHQIGADMARGPGDTNDRRLSLHADSMTDDHGLNNTTWPPTVITRVPPGT